MKIGKLQRCWATMMINTIDQNTWIHGNWVVYCFQEFDDKFDQDTQYPLKVFKVKLWNGGLSLKKTKDIYLNKEAKQDHYYHHQ